MVKISACVALLVVLLAATSLGGAGVAWTARPSIDFYSTRDGGRRAFGAGTGFITIASNAEAQFCAFENPAGSGVDIYLDVGEFSSNQNTEFRRYVGQTLLTRGTAVPVRNLGGGTTASVAKLYVAGQYTTATPDPASIGKVAYLSAYNTYFTSLRGRSVVRPGRAVYWTIDGTSSNVKGNVYLEWYELPAQPD